MISYPNETDLDLDVFKTRLHIDEYNRDLVHSHLGWVFTHSTNSILHALSLHNVFKLHVAWEKAQRSRSQLQQRREQSSQWSPWYTKSIFTIFQPSQNEETRHIYQAWSWQVNVYVVGRWTIAGGGQAAATIKLWMLILKTNRSFHQPVAVSLHNCNTNGSTAK